MGNPKSANLPIELAERINKWLDSQKYYKRLKAESKTIELGDGSKYPLYRSDVLTRDADGTYTKHTGLCITGLEISDDEVEGWDLPIVLELM